jgi:hypothetical protein
LIIFWSKFGFLLNGVLDFVHQKAAQIYKRRNCISNVLKVSKTLYKIEYVGQVLNCNDIFVWQQVWLLALLWIFSYETFIRKKIVICCMMKFRLEKMLRRKFFLSLLNVLEAIQIIRDTSLTPLPLSYWFLGLNCLKYQTN